MHLLRKVFLHIDLCINSLRYLMPGMVCLCVSFPLFSMLQAIGKASAPLKIMLLGTIVKLIGNLLLIPSMCADGAAISTSVCYIVILAVSLAVYIKSAGICLNIAPFISVLYAGILCGADKGLLPRFALKIKNVVFQVTESPNQKLLVLILLQQSEVPAKSDFSGILYHLPPRLLLYREVFLYQAYLLQTAQD